jgi:hypothetical protein
LNPVVPFLSPQCSVTIESSNYEDKKELAAKKKAEAALSELGGIVFACAYQYLREPPLSFPSSIVEE